MERFRGSLEALQPKRHVESLQRSKAGAGDLRGERQVFSFQRT